MRLFISFFVVLMLILTLTPLASAGFTVANDSDVKIEVIYGYWDGDQNLFRIRGYYHILPNESKSLWAPAGVTEVFARIWQSQSNNVVKHDRDSYQSSKVHPRLAFDVFYKQDGTIVRSDVPHNELVTRSDFYKYANNTTFRYKGPVEAVSTDVGAGNADNTGHSNATGISLTFTKRDGTPLPTRLESGDAINLVVKLTNNGLAVADQKVTLKITAVSISKKPTLAVTKKIGKDGTTEVGGAFTSEFGVNTNAQGEIPITMQLDLVATGTFKLAAVWSGVPGIVPSVKKEVSIQVAPGSGAKAKSMDITASTNSYISRASSNRYVVEPKAGNFNSGTIPLTFKLISEANAPLPRGNFLATVSTTKGSVAAQFEVDTSNPDKRNVNLKTDSNGVKKVNLKLTNASTGDLTVTGRISKGGEIVTAYTLNIAVKQTASRLQVTGIKDGQSITSGDKLPITATVKSRNGRPMSGVPVVFYDGDDREISFSHRHRITKSSGKASVDLQTGSEGSADFRIMAGSAGRKEYKITVVPWQEPFSERKVYFESDYADALGERLTCIGLDWETKVKYAHLPSRVVQSTVTVKDVAGDVAFGFGNDNAVMKKWEWHDRDTIKITASLKEHCAETNTLRVYINGEYKGTDSSRPVDGAPPLQPQIRPEMDTLSVFWEDMSQVPSETVLLSNYPNPFNPETWIPYHLAEPADVTLTIYSVEGKVVRRLDLGHQAAGYYQSKSRAAYWDGRNAVGERVASGVYFYTLTAGDFAATQKMLIMK